MTVLLHLDDRRADRLVRRIDAGKRFSTNVPDGTLRLTRRWRLCVVVADHAFTTEDVSGETIVDRESNEGAVVVAFGRIRATPKAATTDERVMVERTDHLWGGIPLEEMIRLLPNEYQGPANSVRGATAVDLGEGATPFVRSALDTLMPGVAQVIDGLLPGDDDDQITGRIGENLAFQRDAVRLALSIAGIESDVNLDESWSGFAGGSYLDNLSYEPRERALVNYDAVRFPDWQLQSGGDPDWLIFSDGEQHLRIGNVDSTPLEEVLGVDLIYRHVDADTFVLVQYKRMVKEQDGNWWYRPDDQLSVEIDRMERVDQSARQGKSEGPSTWRLHPHACYLKLVKPPSSFDPTSDRLLPGIYLPLEYLKELLLDDSTLGPRKGRRLGFESVDRYITTGLFTSLVREGWIGSSGVTTAALSQLVDTAVAGRRSALIAEEAGTVPGTMRRNRRRNRPLS